MKEEIKNNQKIDNQPAQYDDDRPQGDRYMENVESVDGDLGITAKSNTGITKSSDINITPGKASDNVGLDGAVNIDGEINNRDRVVMFDDFLRGPHTFTDDNSDTVAVEPTYLGPFIPVLGSTPATAVSTAANGGKMVLSTGNADGGAATDPGQMSSFHPLKPSNGGFVFETKLHINTAITKCRVFAGVTDIKTLEAPFTNASDVITSNATDAAGFLYDYAATTLEWFACAVDSDSDDANIATTGEAPVADTDQTLRLEISADGSTLKFYVDGTLVTTLSGSYGVTPSSDLYGVVYINTDTVTHAAKSVDIDYMYYGSDRA